MKYAIATIVLLWGLVLTAEPALATCSYHTYIIDGRVVTCTTCCYGAGGCSTEQPPFFIPPQVRARFRARDSGRPRAPA